MSAARDVGVNTTWAGCGPGSGAGGSGTTGRRSTVRRQVAQWRRSQTRAMLWRGVWGWVLGGAGTCGGRGGGGAVTWEGARRRSDASDVCVVLRVERSLRRSSSRPALSSRGGAPWGEEECHMPSRLNPDCVGGAGSRGGCEVLGEVHCGGCRVELGRGGEAGGVAGSGCQDGRVREQVPREE